MATSFFPSEHRSCALCQIRRKKVKGHTLKEFYHKAVVCHLIGHEFALPLDLELIRPGENENGAAKRLLSRVIQRYGRFFDAVVGDAIYLNGLFIDDCLDHKKDVIAVLKDNNKTLIEDALGFFSLIKPRVWKKQNKTITYWDEEGFQGHAKTPLRIMRTVETTSKRKRVCNQWIPVKQTVLWMWATTISKTRLPSQFLHSAAHARWDIENDLFNLLANYWSLDHCFKHHPDAILNFTLTLFIAFVLIQSFYKKNLKPQLRNIMTLTSMGEQIYSDLLRFVFSTPWIEHMRGPPARLGLLPSKT